MTPAAAMQLLEAFRTGQSGKGLSTYISVATRERVTILPRFVALNVSITIAFKALKASQTGKDGLHPIALAFRKVPRLGPVRPTFMELSGYPHYETVCSNILAFFLDPASPHGLGSLCLDALLEAARCSVAGLPLSNVTVEREVQTDSGKLLDILVDSDSALIAVENKIYAVLTNPLSDYADFVAKRAAERKVEQPEVLKLILALAPPASEPGHGFRGLSYKDFTAVLRSKLGHYARRANSRYLGYLFDFLDTIDDLQRGTQMDAAWLDFARDHREGICSPPGLTERGGAVSRDGRQRWIFSLPWTGKYESRPV